MMSLHRLGPMAEEYYLSQVAAGIEDYYSESREAPGRWLSRSAELLGLDGQVDGQVLRAVLRGHDPSTDAPLHRAHNRSTPGWDLTFRAPKSVSVLWGLGDRDIAHAVADAHHAAVTTALDYLERTAGFTRTGHNGVHRVEATAFLAAGFDHRTSRDGDPHLHTHVLVANSVQASDGRWRTIDGRGIYRHKMAASYLYDAELRHQLTARLGVEWTFVVKGIAEIASIDPDLCWQFSKRREVIEDKLAEWGASSGAAAEVAALTTRRAKTATEPTALLTARWRAEATQAGWDPETVIAGAVRPAAARPPRVDAEASTAALGQLAGPLGVTHHESTFDRRDVVRHLACVLPPSTGAAQIETLADEFLSRSDVVEVRSPHPELTFTTQELLDTERRLLTDAANRLDESCAVVDPSHVAAAITARPSMAQEQTDLVRQLCFSGAGVEVVVAPPGTGKTFSLDAARHAWEAAGHRVIGCALSASAAAELRDGAGIESHTIHQLTRQIRSGRTLDHRTVLVVDEAGMAGTRQLAPLLDAASRHGTKVVLVGDPKQLPEIHAGGLLAELERQLPIVRLATNRRQRDDAEVYALDRLRAGDPTAALATFVDGDRTIGPDAETVRDRMVADWWAHLEAGHDARMLASRWADADDLNRRARRIMRDAGRLRGETILVDERPFQIGDQIVCLRNDYPNGLRNGMTGTIESIDHQHRRIAVTTDDGRRVLPTEYVDEGHLRHGYAVTVHKAQGSTCDHSLLLGSDKLYREMGYVALSRGRLTNRMYVVDSPAVATDEQLSILDNFADRLRDSHAKPLALRSAEPAIESNNDLGLG